MYSTVSQSTEDAGYAFFHYRNLYPPTSLLNPEPPQVCFCAYAMDSFDNATNAHRNAHPASHLLMLKHSPEDRAFWTADLSSPP